MGWIAKDKEEPMMWQETPYTILLVGASAISAALGAYIWRRFRDPEAAVGALLMVAGAEWILAYALELAGGDLATKIFWAKMKYVGIVIIPTAWLVFALQYTAREKWVTRRRAALLSVVPCVTLLLVFTNENHGLIWSALTLTTDGSFSVLSQTYGVWFWGNVSYSYALVLLGAFPLTQMLIRSQYLYRWQTSAILLGAVTPWVGSALDVSGLNPMPYLELTPLTFAVADVAIVFSLFYLGLGDVVPVAREIIIERMGDSVIVLDAQNRIIDVNPSAQALISRPASELLGHSLKDVWPEQSFQIELIDEKTEAGKEIVFAQESGQRTYDMRISSLSDWRGRILSRIVVFRDITDRKRAEEHIKQSLEEKKVLLREIHHRVKNNLQVISSLLNLQSAYIDDCQYREMFKESQNRVKSMSLIHEKLYQSENLANIDFEEYVRALTNGLIRSYGINTDKVSLEVEVDNVSLGIDTAIPCGLIINELVSNSLKHAFPGGKGEILVSLHSNNGITELTVKDNGVGIPEDIHIKNTTSLGLRLVCILAQDQLSGNITLMRTNGTEFRITFGEVK
jgi:PAS domain S-box-containing protein